MPHYIQYRPHHIVTHAPHQITHPWYSREKPNREGVYALTHDCVPPSITATQLKPGDTLWVIGQLFSPEGVTPELYLPAALEARIEIRSTSRIDSKKYRIDAGQGSTRFPLADATATLMKIRQVTKNGKDKPLATAPITNSLRQLRGIHRITDAEPLEKLALRLQTEQYDYISYCQTDGIQQAFKLAQDLVASEGRVVAWDLWGIPEQLVEGRNIHNDQELTRYLERMLDGAQTIYSVESEDYRQANSYSLTEALQAELLGHSVSISDTPDQSKYIGVNAKYWHMSRYLKSPPLTPRPAVARKRTRKHRPRHYYGLGIKI